MTPNARRVIVSKKGGVKRMTKEAERFTLRLTGELKEQLDGSRKRMGVSLNALVVQILWEWVNERQQTNREKGEM